MERDKSSYAKCLSFSFRLRDFHAMFVETTPPQLQDTSDVIKGRENEEPGITFDPPAYIQRYQKVAEILREERWISRIKTVADFGCAELSFFKYVKNLNHVTKFYEIDIDESLLTKYAFRVNPFPGEYVVPCRTSPLRIEVLAGSIAECDSRLLQVDAFVCIEIIEHLNADVLAKVPNIIFGFARPKLAIFTTPNVEFNVLFDMKEKFRHDDHKFEWTREEFQKWGDNIADKYPYDVRYEGIAAGPDGTQNLGCCTQMAIFELKQTASDENFPIPFSENLPNCYKVIKTIDFPFRTWQEKFEAAVVSTVCNMSHEFERRIPLIKLYPALHMYCDSLDQLRVNMRKFLSKKPAFFRMEEDCVIVAEDSETETDESECDEEDKISNFPMFFGSEEEWDA